MAIDVDSIVAPLDPLPAAPAPVAPPRPRQPWHWRIGQTLSAYLPILLMALLAWFTWWLVQNTPRPDAPQAEAPARHEPDYLMNGVLLQRFAPDGRLLVQVQGTQLRHYPDNDTIEIDTVTIRAWSASGELTLATARRALANGDASEVQLLGGARVVREGPDRIEFDGEFLHAFLKTERVKSHLPVRVLRGTSQLDVGALDYDHLARVARLGPPIRARFEAVKR
jgi:lipopolysaccharide export system protein LptC